MTKRWGKPHASPLPELPDFSYLPPEHYNAKVDVENSKRDLKARCPKCRERIEKYENS